MLASAAPTQLVIGPVDLRHHPIGLHDRLAAQDVADRPRDRAASSSSPVTSSIRSASPPTSIAIDV